MSYDQITVSQCYLPVLSGFVASSNNMLRALGSHMASAKYRVLAYSHEQHCGTQTCEQDQQHDNPNQSLLHSDRVNDQHRNIFTLFVSLNVDNRFTTFNQNKTYKVLLYTSVQIFGNNLNKSTFYSGRN